MVGPTPRRSPVRAPRAPDRDLAREPVLHPPHVLRDAVRTLLPGWGARANAREAVAQDRRAAQARRAAALDQAHALGPGSWIPLDEGSAQAWPASGSRHGVDLYADDAQLLTGLTAYVADGLAAAEVCLVAATPGHRAGLVRRLALHGLTDPGDRLVLIDAQALLDRFLRDGWPDPQLFDREVGELVRARGGGAPLRVFGEMVGLLQAAGLGPAALQLEKLWVSLQDEVDFDLLCGYPARSVQEPEAEAAVLAHHSHVVAPLR